METTLGQAPWSVLLDIWNLPQVQQTVEETARQIFTSGNITVNALPALLALAALAGLALLLLPLLFPGDDGGSGTIYEVSDGYGAPSSSYGAPSSGYGSRASEYDAASYSEASYAAPASEYDESSPAYTAGRRRRREVQVPREARLLYLDTWQPLAGHQDQAVLQYSPSAGLRQDRGPSQASLLSP